MRYAVLFVVGICLITQNLWGQSVPKDSVKTIALEEILICHLDDDKNQSFNFYKNNKLASTEDILSRLQGVNLIRRGAYGLEPGLRNYTGGQTNITIDGMKIYGACTDKMDPVSIYVEPTNLSSIQVAHGASGTMNGSTIGGQINFKLKEPAFDCHSKVSGQVSQSYLTVNNGYFVSGALQQSAEKYAYRINGTYRKARNYRAGDQTLIPYSGFEKYNLGATALFKISPHQILKADYLGDWGKNIGYPALPMDVGSAVAQIISMSHKIILKNNYFTENELKVYYNAITHQMDDTHRADAPMHMDMPGWTRTSGFYNEIKANENLKLRLDFHRVYARADMIMYPVGEPQMYLQTLPENHLNDVGLAAKYNLKFKRQEELIVNARFDFISQVAAKEIGYLQWKVFDTDISKMKTNFLKNGSLVYSKRFGARIQSQLTVGYSERTPTSNERYGFYLFNRQDQFDYIGNLNLKPEQSLQTEFSIKQVLKKVEYGLNLFYHHINNYIYAYRLENLSQMTIGAYGIKTYKNIDYAISKGFEFNVKAALHEHLTYIGSVKYVSAKTFSGQYLPLIPPLKLQHALRFNYHFFQIQLEHDYAIKQDKINSDYGDKITPAYHLFNIRISRNFILKSKVLQASLSCENIFDVKYREHLDIGQIPRYGRNFLINLNYLF